MKTISISRTHLVRLLAALVLAFGGLTLPNGNARAVGTITVINNNDDGEGSLRQAIADAGAGNIILFDNDYTITLKSELTIDKNLTIDGGKNTIVVSGDNAVRVLMVAEKITFHLDHLTVTEGEADSGGGIDNSGTINITNSTFSANTAKDNGGGVHNGGGSLTITNSTFSANSATDGGGIFNDHSGTVTITNSTFSANSASDGGGINNSDGTVTLNNTILANSTSGGNCSGTITNGGNNMDDGTTCGWGSASGSKSSTAPLLSALGSYGGPTQTFALLPGSAAIDAGNPVICAADPVNNLDQRGVTRPSACDIGAFESRGFTLAISSGSGQSAGVNNAFTNPLVVSVSSASGEPVDGGTVAFAPPASGASAVITGSPAVISGGHAQVSAAANENLGSYNVSASTRGDPSGVDFALQNISCLAITVANSNDSGAGSLRWAITNICAGGTITFAGDTTIYLASRLTIDKDMTIDGLGHTVTVSGDTDNNGSGNVGVFWVNSGVTFNLNNLAVSKGWANQGGGIYNEYGTVTITNSTFSANSSDAGGGIANYGSLNITNSTFSANSAGMYGGGIFNANVGTLNGTLTVTNSTFSANSASSGGGIANYDGTTNITNSTFSANTAFAVGGGISTDSGTITLRNTIVANSPSGGNCSGTITDGGYNLVWGDSTCPFIHADPRLGALANNGGPTQTFALLPGSAAIDAGSDAICTAAPVNNLDQRGVARPRGAQCDIGAYETARVVRDDFDGDRKTDPAKFIPSGAVWYLQSSTGTWQGTYMGPGTYAYVNGGDYDGDGKTDPAEFISVNALWYLQSNTATWQGVYMGPGTYTLVKSSDYDGDGKTDPALFVSGLNALWYLQSSTSTWQGVYTGPGSYQMVPASDFDGDGKTDPAQFSASSNVLWYLKSSTGTWQGVYLGPGTYNFVAASDFDGDGKTDPAHFDPSTNVLWYLQSKGGGWQSVWKGSETMTYVSGCDFDGDGKTDPAIYVASTHTLSWYKISTGIWTDVYLGSDTFTLAIGQ